MQLDTSKIPLFLGATRYAEITKLLNTSKEQILSLLDETPAKQS